MCHATFQKTPISVSTLDKNPMPGHLFECNTVDEVKTRRGTDILIALTGKTRIKNIRIHTSMRHWIEF